MKRLFLLTLTVLAFTAVSAQAGEGKGRHGGHHKRPNLIKAGVKSGELTKEEAKSLRAERKKIKELREAAKSDGEVSEEERANLKKAKEAFVAKAKELSSNGEKREAPAAGEDDSH